MQDSLRGANSEAKKDDANKHDANRDYLLRWRHGRDVAIAHSRQCQRDEVNGGHVLLPPRGFDQRHIHCPDKPHLPQI